MPIPSNYPPGVSGNEPQIIGEDDDPDVAWDREESEPCEAGTPGCCLHHRPTAPIQRPCETW